MSERVKVTSKTPESKRDNSVSRIRKTDSSRSTSSPVDHILFLQRTIGNQAVQRLFKSGVIQAKLKIGQPNDIYEQEADRVADEVMRMPEPQVHRQAEEEEEILQMKVNTNQTTEVFPGLESPIHALRGGGQHLPKETRVFMEKRFQTDFSDVRLHTDRNAAEINRGLNAEAFTYGKDIYFGARRYSPGTSSGKRLLAHELTHVVQQTQKANNHGNIWRKPAGRARFESGVLKDVPFDPDPKRELFFEADILKKLSEKLAEVRIPDPWGPYLMWRSNFRRDVYRKLTDMKPAPKTASLAVDFKKGATLEESYILFEVVSTSMEPPPTAGVELLYEPERKEVPALRPPLPEKPRTVIEELPSGAFKASFPLTPEYFYPVSTYLIVYAQGEMIVEFTLPPSEEALKLKLKKGKLGVELEKKLNENLKVKLDPENKIALSISNIVGEKISLETGFEWSKAYYAPYFAKVKYEFMEVPLSYNLTGKITLAGTFRFGPSPGLLTVIGKTGLIAGSTIAVSAAVVVFMAYICKNAGEVGDDWGRSVSFRNGYSMRVGAETGGVRPRMFIKYVEKDVIEWGSPNESFLHGWNRAKDSFLILERNKELQKFCHDLQNQYGTTDWRKIADRVIQRLGDIGRGGIEPPTDLWKLIDKAK